MSMTFEEHNKRTKDEFIKFLSRTEYLLRQKNPSFDAGQYSITELFTSHCGTQDDIDRYYICISKEYVNVLIQELKVQGGFEEEVKLLQNAQKSIEYPDAGNPRKYTCRRWVFFYKIDHTGRTDFVIGKHDHHFIPDRKYIYEKYDLSHCFLRSLQNKGEEWKPIPRVVWIIMIVYLIGFIVLASIRFGG